MAITADFFAVIAGHAVFHGMAIAKSIGDHITCCKKIFLFDICLFENRDQRICGDLHMAGNRNEARMQEMNMAPGLVYRFETKTRENLNYFTS